MPLKADVQRNFPVLESLSAPDLQKLILWAHQLSDTLETISRRAQEAGQIAEEVKATQETLVNNLTSPAITHSQDSVLGSIGNLSADLTTKTVGAVPVGGKIKVKDNAGNFVNILVE